MTTRKPSQGLLDPRRAVPASIRGHLYQAAVGVRRWLALEEGEVLLCEGDEDLDRRSSTGVTREQVKDLRQRVSIRDLCETVRSFVLAHVMQHRRGGMGHFVFTSTARKAQQRTSDVGVDVLDAWADLKQRDQVVSALRTLLPVLKPKKRSEEIANALSWLDCEPERWAGFLGSVQWRFGEPDLAGVRTEIGEWLRSDAAAKKLPRDLLIDSLMAEVLWASSRSDVDERILDRRALFSVFATTSAELEAWAASSEGEVLRAAIKESLVLEGLLDDGVGTLEANPSPGKLLTAAFEVIPFDEDGRSKEIGLLQRFCDANERRGVLLLTGDGGVGKTRLMIEWCRRLSGERWHAGFLRRHARLPEPDILLKGTTPRLVVVDYAETRLDDVIKPLLEVMATGSGTARLRLVLLARRSADPAARLPHEVDWWEALKQTSDEVEKLLDRWKPRVIGALVAGFEARANAVNAAQDRFAHVLGHKVDSLTASTLDDDRFDRALYLYMAALDAVLGGDEDARGDPLARTLRHERRFWQREIERLGLDAYAREVLKEAVDPVMATVTLLGGVSAHTSEATIGAVVGGDLDPADRRRLLRLLQRLFGEPGGHAIGPLTPDLLGEQLVTEQLDHDASLLVAALDLGDENAQANVLVTVTRIAQRLPSARIWLSRLLNERQETVASLARKVAVTTDDPTDRELAQQISRHKNLLPSSKAVPIPKAAELTILISWSALLDNHRSPDPLQRTF